MLIVTAAMGFATAACGGTSHSDSKGAQESDPANTIIKRPPAVSAFPHKELDPNLVHTSYPIEAVDEALINFDYSSIEPAMRVEDDGLEPDGELRFSAMGYKNFVMVLGHYVGDGSYSDPTAEQFENLWRPKGVSMQPLEGTGFDYAYRYGAVAGGDFQPALVYVKVVDGYRIECDFSSQQLVGSSRAAMEKAKRLQVAANKVCPLLLQGS